MSINDFTEKERKIISKFFDMNTVFNPYDESLLEIDIHWDYIYSIPEFAALKTLHQSPKWHSESEFVSGHVERVANECKSWIECVHNIDEEFAVILMMSALFHDIGKLEELSAFPANDYTDEGQLLGHIAMGMEIVGMRIRSIDGFPRKLANELKHCILAHHGELEYGSPKKPAIPEAVALNFADNLDAKMETMKELFVNVPEGNTDWQGFNRLFDSNIRRSSV